MHANRKKKPPRAHADYVTDTFGLVCVCALNARCFRRESTRVARWLVGAGGLSPVKSNFGVRRVCAHCAHRSFCSNWQNSIVSEQSSSCLAGPRGTANYCPNTVFGHNLTVLRTFRTCLAVFIMDIGHAVEEAMLDCTSAYAPCTPPQSTPRHPDSLHVRCISCAAFRACTQPKMHV